MFISWLLKGLLIGFSIAMPVGPIGLLCIRNALMGGLVAGFVSGLGAACADAIYGGIAAFGISTVNTILDSHGFYLQLAGALFLFYLGIKTFFAKPTQLTPTITVTSLPRLFFTTFFLTLTNPLTVLSFAGIYAGIGMGSENLEYQAALIVTFGVLLGSTIWWLLLSFSASCFKEKINERATLWLNRVSGSLIFSFGIAALAA